MRFLSGYGSSAGIFIAPSHYETGSVTLFKTASFGSKKLTLRRFLVKLSAFMPYPY
jgi:hypothetical protein